MLCTHVLHIAQQCARVSIELSKYTKECCVVNKEVAQNTAVPGVQKNCQNVKYKAQCILWFIDGVLPISQVHLGKVTQVPGVH